MTEAKSPAQRQRQYRQSTHDRKQVRINTYVSMQAGTALQRLAKHHKVTKRQMLELLILAAEDAVAEAMPAEGQSRFRDLI